MTTCNFIIKDNQYELVLTALKINSNSGKVSGKTNSKRTWAMERKQMLPLISNLSMTYWTTLSPPAIECQCITICGKDKWADE